MRAEQLKRLVQGLPNDTDIVIKINKYELGNLRTGRIGGVTGCECVDVDNYDINGAELVLECTVVM